MYREVIREISGIPSDTLIEGKTCFENVQTIEYDVNAEAGSEHFS